MNFKITVNKIERDFKGRISHIKHYCEIELKDTTLDAEAIEKYNELRELFSSDFTLELYKPTCEKIAG